MQTGGKTLIKLISNSFNKLCKYSTVSSDMKQGQTQLFFKLYTERVLNSDLHYVDVRLE